MTDREVTAHDQPTTNRYTVHFPEHPPREGDPHYAAFEHYRREHVDTAVCHFAERRGGDTSECAGGLELHHSHVEFSMQNGADAQLLEHEHPGITTDIPTWVESADNLVFYCEKHHRGHGGVHHASASDFEASHFVRNLIS